jgi:hypothetical protein
VALSVLTARGAVLKTYHDKGGIAVVNTFPTAKEEQKYT